MSTILDEIVADKRKELETTKSRKKISDLVQAPMFGRRTISLKESLQKPHSSGIIAEFKRKSPSKGWIHPDADPLETTKMYCENGAAALSILTNEKYFGGNTEYIETCRKHSTCPILRKEFIVDEFQVYEAKAIGADAILLIAAALTKEEMRRLSQTAHDLHLEVLMEIHEEKELEYGTDNVDVVGVNNRDLKTFSVDVRNSVTLSEKIPSDRVKISESGIGDVETIRNLREVGYMGFLMGERFMKAMNPAEELRMFVEQLRNE